MKNSYEYKNLTVAIRYAFNFEYYEYLQVCVIGQQAMKDIAKDREALEKAKRAKEAQEKRERERQEKIARTNALVDINGGMLASYGCFC